MRAVCNPPLTFLPRCQKYREREKGKRRPARAAGINELNFSSTTDNEEGETNREGSRGRRLPRTRPLFFPSAPIEREEGRCE